jgi:hypothetical protein
LRAADQLNRKLGLHHMNFANIDSQNLLVHPDRQCRILQKCVCVCVDASLLVVQSKFRRNR